MEHPLNGAVEEHRVRQIGDLAIEPEVNTGDRRGPEAVEHGTQRRCRIVRG
jgi:hypothetical protein